MSKSFAEQKAQAMATILGREHSVMMHAVIPYEVGGSLDLYYYPNSIPGTGIATQELIRDDATGNRTRGHNPYELAMFTRLPLDLDSSRDTTSEFGKAHNRINSAINLIAMYGSKTALSPKDTFEYPADGPVEARRYFLFDEYAPEGNKLVIDGKECLLLLVMEIHRSELLLARQRSTAHLIEILKKPGVYPYSDMDRPPVDDVSVIEAADCWDQGAVRLGRLIPSYLQRHLAGRASDHLLARSSDGEIEVDDAPGMLFFPLPEEAQEKACADFLRLMNEQLPNRPEFLAALTAKEIVTRLCGIYRAVTGVDSYSRVCMAWCIQKKLVSGAERGVSPPPLPPAAGYCYAKAGRQFGPVGPTGVLEYESRDSAVANAVRPVHYVIYISLLIGTFLCLLGAMIILVNQGKGASTAPLVLRILALVQFAGLVVYAALILHRGWKLLPQHAARTTPGKAVGLMFVPLFNLYWVFQAIYGWARDYNASLATAHPQAPKANEGLFLALCILHALVVLPMCGVLFALAAVVVQPIVVWQICRSINHFAPGRDASNY